MGDWRWAAFEKALRKSTESTADLVGQLPVRRCLAHGRRVKRRASRPKSPKPTSKTDTLADKLRKSVAAAALHEAACKGKKPKKSKLLITPDGAILVAVSEEAAEASTVQPPLLEDNLDLEAPELEGNLEQPAQEVDDEASEHKSAKEQLSSSLRRATDQERQARQKKMQSRSMQRAKSQAEDLARSLGLSNILAEFDEEAAARAIQRNVEEKQSFAIKWEKIIAEQEQVQALYGKTADEEDMAMHQEKLEEEDVSVSSVLPVLDTSDVQELHVRTSPLGVIAEAGPGRRHNSRPSSAARAGASHASHGLSAGRAPGSRPSSAVLKSAAPSAGVGVSTLRRPSSAPPGGVKHRDSVGLIAPHAVWVSSPKEELTVARAPSVWCSTAKDEVKVARANRWLDGAAQLPANHPVRKRPAGRPSSAVSMRSASSAAAGRGGSTLRRPSSAPTGGRQKPRSTKTGQ